MYQRTISEGFHACGDLEDVGRAWNVGTGYEKVRKIWNNNKVWLRKWYNADWSYKRGVKRREDSRRRVGEWARDSRGAEMWSLYSKTVVFMPTMTLKVSPSATAK